MNSMGQQESPTPRGTEGGVFYNCTKNKKHPREKLLATKIGHFPEM